jgi:MoxR-like ATPase
MSTTVKAVSVDGWNMFELALKYLDRIYLYGAPGLGKTYAATHSRAERHLKQQREVVNATLSDDIVLQELIGHYMPKGTEFVWHDGPVITAMRNGQLLVLNELARASSAVKDAMLGVLDGNGSASIPLPSGEIVVPEKGFQVVATANSSTDDLDPALADRFEAVVYVNVPHPQMIEALDAEVKGLGTAVAASFKDDPARAISPRSAFTFTKLVKAGVSAKQAAQLAFGQRASDIVAAFKLAGVGAA